MDCYGGTTTVSDIFLCMENISRLQLFTNTIGYGTTRIFFIIRGAKRPRGTLRPRNHLSVRDYLSVREVPPGKRGAP